MLNHYRIFAGVFAVTLATFALAAVAQTQGPTTLPNTPQSSELALTAMSLGKVFTYFMVMLGPTKLIGPFAKLTRGMDASASRNLALKGFAIACIAGLTAAILGQDMLNSWGVSLTALLIAAGLVLLLVALKAILSQFDELPAASVEPSEPAPAASRFLAIFPLAFPMIITPYGIAALILLLAAAAPGQSLGIFGVFLAVMVINLATMVLARPILKYGGGVLALLDGVLGVLQLALAIGILLLACRMLGVLH
jgi:multiple antibiotic resistance protein